MQCSFDTQHRRKLYAKKTRSFQDKFVRKYPEWTPNLESKVFICGFPHLNVPDVTCMQNRRLCCFVTEVNSVIEPKVLKCKSSW